MSKEKKLFEFLSLYKASLKDQEAVKKAAIKVEKTNGPILLISGDDDRVWPSKEMSEKIVERIKTNEFPFEYRHLCYECAGTHGCKTRIHALAKALLCFGRFS